MMIWRVKNFSARKILRLVLSRITKSFIVKVVTVGSVVMLTFSLTVFYLEKQHVFYINEKGVTVEDHRRSSNIRSIEDSIWWAFVTSTTVGYGDYFPKSPWGRAVGILLMFFGISLVGVITGNIASLLVGKQLKEGRGLKDLKLKKHFIICGWKRDMADVLSLIMEKNKDYLPSEIVLINTAPPEEIENLRSEPKFAGVNYIHGDYIDERVLNRASLKKANKVLVLADRLITGAVQEVDSRTVMAIITIKAMSKTIYTCAELLDMKFERYLRFSNCDEIILSMEYNRKLIANASAGSGISHVVSELLDVNSDVSINTRDIPARFVGRAYGELFDYFVKLDRTVLIGILENTGNFHTRKQEAIREAQKTPDISKLVDNLKTVKSLVANQPVINPYPEYAINKYSRAIIIDGRSPASIKQMMRESSHGAK